MYGSAQTRKTTLQGLASNTGRIIRMPIDKRRHRRTLFESMHHWIYKNGTWVFVVLGLSLLGTFLALAAHNFGETVSTVVRGAVSR